MCDLEAEQSASKIVEAKASADQAVKAYQNAAWAARERGNKEEAHQWQAQRNYWMGIKTGLNVAQMSVGCGQLEELRDLIECATKECQTAREAI